MELHEIIESIEKHGLAGCIDRTAEALECLRKTEKVVDVYYGQLSVQALATAEIVTAVRIAVKKCRTLADEYDSGSEIDYRAGMLFVVEQIQKASVPEGPPGAASTEVRQTHPVGPQGEPENPIERVRKVLSDLVDVAKATPPWRDRVRCLLQEKEAAMALPRGLDRARRGLVLQIVKQMSDAVRTIDGLEHPTMQSPETQWEPYGRNPCAQIPIDTKGMEEKRAVQLAKVQLARMEGARCGRCRTAMNIICDILGYMVEEGARGDTGAQGMPGLQGPVGDQGAGI